MVIFAFTMAVSFDDDIIKACEILKRGGVILYPTDTIWGIGCDARSEESVKRVYKIKKRAESKALITLVSDENMLEKFVGNVPQIVLPYIRQSQRPTTVIYPKCEGVASNLLAEDGSIGIRITGEEWSSKLCELFSAPIVSTSANISGEKTPMSFSEISTEIIDAVDYVAENKRDSLPSSASKIIKIKNNTITIIRE